VARRSLILDAGALIALSRGDRTVRAHLAAALQERAAVIVPPVVLTQTMRGGSGDVMVHRLLQTAFVPFVGKRLAIAAGVLLGQADMADAADAQVMAEAIRSGPSILLTSDLVHLQRLAAGRSDVRVLGI
jgi:hypothetical protein